jgi:PAS domain S-box-containing protein
MKDPDKNKSQEQLISEIRELRNQNAKLLNKMSGNLLENDNDFLVHERIELAIESGNGGFWDLNLEKQSLFLSRSHYDLLGYNSAEIKLNFLVWKNLIHPEDIYKVKKELLNAVKLKLLNYSFEYRIKLKSGNYKWLYAKAKVVKWNANGYANCIIGTHTDITHQKRVEESLRKSEQFFSSTFENAEIGMAIINTNFKLVSVNKAFCRISGYSQDDLIEMTYLNLIPSKDIPTVQNKISDLLSGKISKYQVERRYLKKDNSVLWINLTATVVYDSKFKPEFIIGMGEDITEKKHHEKIQTAVYNITSAINTTKDFFEFFKVIKSNVLDVFGIKDFYIALYDNSKDIFNVPNIKNDKNEYYSFPVKNSLSALVLNNKYALILNEDEIKEQINKKVVKLSDKIPKHWLGVPLFANNKTIGILGVQSFDSSRVFTEKDKEILEFISNQVGLLIQKKQSEDALKIERAHFKELLN